MSNFGRNLALWVIIALLLVVLFNLFQPGTSRNAATQVAYSDFISEVNGGRVKDVVIQGRTVGGQLSDGRSFQTYTPEDPTLVSRLTDKGVRVIAKPEERVGVLHAPDAGGRRARDGLRQVPRPAADREAGARHV